MAITFAINLNLAQFSTIQTRDSGEQRKPFLPPLGGDGRGEGGLQTKIKLPFRIFKQSLTPKSHLVLKYKSSEHYHHHHARDLKEVSRSGLLARIDRVFSTTTLAGS
jgi:hypothetical protein